MYKKMIAMTFGAALLATPATEASAEVSFAGQTIRIIVSFAAGGPADSFIRHFQPHLEQNIPGKPTVIVENRPGAAGLAAANYVYNVARPDGLTIGFLVAVTYQALIGGPQVKLDVTKFRWLGAVPQSQVLLVRDDLQIASAQDFLNPAKDIVYGTTGVNSPSYVLTTLFFEMIGASYQAVHGYRGQAETIQALRQGEVNVTDAGISIYVPNRETWRKEGVFSAIVQRGQLDVEGRLRRHASMPDLPTIEEMVAELAPAALQSPQFAAYRALVGTFGVQFPLVLPPDTDEAIVRTLAEATAATFTDQEVMASATKRFRVAYDFLDGESTRGYVERLFREYAADPEVPKVVQQRLKRD